MNEITKVNGNAQTRDMFGTLTERNALVTTGLPVGSTWTITDNAGTLGDTYLWDGTAWGK
jgi:hypothetical protein